MFWNDLISYNYFKICSGGSLDSFDWASLWSPTVHRKYK